MKKGEIMQLNKEDLNFCARRLPKKLKELMKEKGESIIIAGGYIRSIVTGEKISDIDIFAGDKETSKNLVWELVKNKYDFYETANAITIKNFRLPIQFVYRWVYNKPLDIINSFDFSVCQAAIWYNKAEKKWASYCSKDFYQDLAAKRLVYLSPQRNEDAGGSLLRVLKYYQKGYRIPLPSLGAVLARLLSAVREKGSYGEKSEEWLAKIITSLLFEVDPAALPED